MSQGKSPITPKVFMTTLQTLHLTFSIAPLFLCVAAYLRAENNYLELWEENNPFFLIVPVIVIGGIYAGNFIWNKKVADIENEPSLRAKLMHYQTASIISWAFLEGPALLSVVAFFQSGNQLFLIIAVVVIGYLLMKRPSKEKVIEHLNLSMQEQSDFNQLDKILE